MARKRIATRHPGKHFAVIMLVVLAVLIVLLLSMYRHVSSVPHSGPLPNLIVLLLSMYRHVSSVPHSGPLPNQQLQH